MPSSRVYAIAREGDLLSEKEAFEGVAHSAGELESFQLALYCGIDGIFIPTSLPGISFYYHLQGGTPMCEAHEVGNASAPGGQVVFEFRTVGVDEYETVIARGCVVVEYI